jgi:AbrB family looped-hinge helix DNA binding protein
MQTTISSKGQITVPKFIRDALQLQVGDHINFMLDADGSVRFVPATLPVATLKGILPKPPKTLSLDDMDKAILKGASS